MSGAVFYTSTVTFNRNDAPSFSHFLAHLYMLQTVYMIYRLTCLLSSLYLYLRTCAREFRELMLLASITWDCWRRKWRLLWHVLM